MRALALLQQLPDGPVMALGHGDLVGRTALAALCIDDAQISEAHAMISLRGSMLCLLALRGRLVCDGAITSTLPLAPGQVIELSPRVSIRVCDVQLPHSVLALRAGPLPRHLISGIISVLGAPHHPQLRPGVHPDAQAVVWNTDLVWQLEGPMLPRQAIHPPQQFQLEGLTLEFELVPLETCVNHTTPNDTLRATLSVVGQAVRLVRDGQPDQIIAGVPGRLLATLIQSNGMLPWRDACARIWPDDRSSLASLRRRLDAAISRLRERLRGLQLDNLQLSLDGTGILQLTHGNNLMLQAQVA